MKEKAGISTLVLVAHSENSTAMFIAHDYFFGRLNRAIPRTKD